VEHLDQKKTALLVRMMERGVNAPWTSSCGRLFDAVAALVGIRQVVNYEAQAAIELEMAIEENGLADFYPFELRVAQEGWIIGAKPLFEHIVRDLLGGCGRSVISRKFHLGLAQVFAQVAEMVRERTWIDQVCLSGGTFHNVFLLAHLRTQLEKRGFRVWTHAEVPAGDGGLSLGQALVAAHRVKEANNADFMVHDDLATIVDG
jgi:hydrogenase maturation protein HypF